MSEPYPVYLHKHDTKSTCGKMSTPGQQRFTKKYEEIFLDQWSFRTIHQKMTDELSTDYGCNSLHICSLRQFYRRDSSTHPQSVQSLPTQKASFLRTPCSKRSTNKQQWAARGQQKSKQGTHNVNKRYKANKVESKQSRKQKEEQTSNSEQHLVNRGKPLQPMYWRSGVGHLDFRKSEK